MKQLEQAGVLRETNMLNLKELVNMPEEHIREGFTDEQIKDAVQAKRAGEANREANGGDDDNYVDEEPRPTRREALEASATLRCYLLDSGDASARQMDLILTRFSRQTRLDETNSLLPTSITDYFCSQPQ
ncbi:hypothetical protein B0H10DRAFT_1938097 [Mycena sp. CBHHK59/15]|nr:hypothetical protein B0H10DRAFT_1938097 [Mycena sp. CBHHK59/15]